MLCSKAVIAFHNISWGMSHTSFRQASNNLQNLYTIDTYTHLPIYYGERAVQNYGLACSPS